MNKIVFGTMLDERSRNLIECTFKNINFKFFSDIEHASMSEKEAEVIIGFGHEMTEQVLNNFKNIKWIHTLSAGVDSLPFDKLKQKNVIVTNSRGVHAIPMAEYAIGVMLQLTKHFYDYYNLKKERRWDNSLLAEELEGKVIGIIGTGAIGSTIAKKLQPFNTIINGINTTGKAIPYFDWNGSMDKLDQLLSTSDFVILTIPLTKKTENLITKGQLDLMKTTSYLINLSRGEIVNEEALISILKERKIRGAVLDVFINEPLPKNHPLWELDNVMITPHISDSSPFFFNRVTKILIHNLHCFSRNKNNMMINQVDLEKHY